MAMSQYIWLSTEGALATLQLKVKDCEKLGKFLILSLKLKMLWNMKVTVIPIVVGPLELLPKNLEK